MFSNQMLLKWKQNDGGFQHGAYTNIRKVGKRLIRSLSSSAASTTDRFIQRQRRKQTRLRRKTKSKEKKREEKEKRTKQKITIIKY